ncbi:MAG TPA: hypothetical protein VFO60_01810 [Candidatus Dormibacteraeota bacterium]|nr:hypothetical protein [Candidatus Dormibacteraeota bacterium]
MSFLGRLLGRADPAPPSTPAPPPARWVPPAAPIAPANSVVVPDDVAAALTADGSPLADTVVAALREHLAGRARPPVPEAAATPPPAPEPAPEPAAPPAPAAPAPAAAAAGPASDDRVPFWLGRDDHESGIEDELRGRLERRRAAEAEQRRGRPPEPDAPDD